MSDELKPCTFSGGKPDAWNRMAEEKPGRWLWNKWKGAWYCSECGYGDDLYGVYKKVVIFFVLHFRQRFGNRLRSLVRQPKPVKRFVFGQGIINAKPYNDFSFSV